MKINDCEIYAQPITAETVEIRYAEGGQSVRDNEWTYPKINGQRVWLNDEADETVIIDMAEAHALGIYIRRITERDK